MVRLARLGMAGLLTVTCIAIGRPTVAQAVIGPYTLPFFWPIYGVNQAYGCTNVQIEGAIPTGKSCPPPTPPNPPMKWHSGIDYNMATRGSWVVSSNSGTVGNFREDLLDHETGQNNAGNYVFLRHSSTRFSLYYHLDHLGVIPGAGAAVSAGQHIAFSGDTGLGGYHLHYELDSQGVIGCVPVETFCDLDPNQWTTSPGRVPWRADLLTTMPVTYSVLQYSQWTTAVSFKNIGGRAWPRTLDSNGLNRIWLASVNVPTSPNKSPFSSRVSTFYVAGDWEANTRPGMPNGTTTIPVDGTAVFSFGLRASSTGTYTERFDLRAEGDGGIPYSGFWFDYWEVASMNQYRIVINVEHCC